MARVLLSGLLSDIRGKLNGSVFKQSNAGLIIQNKPPTSSGSQSTTRNIQPLGDDARTKATYSTAVVRNAWNNLTDAQRLAWSAQTNNNVSRQKNNPTLSTTGLQWFLRINVILFQFDEAIILAPTFGAVPPLPQEIVSVQNTGVLNATVDGVFSLDEIAIFSISNPVRNTNNTPGSRLRLMRTPVVNLSSLIEFEPNYIAQFGVAASPGQKVFTSLQMMNKLTGMRSPLINQTFEIV